MRRLPIVVGGVLRIWSEGKEEIRVEPARLDDRRHPVREERERVERQVESLATQHVAQREAAVQQRPAVAAESIRGIGVDGDDGAARVVLAGEQNARFLE